MITFRVKGDKEVAAKFKRAADGLNAEIKKSMLRLTLFLTRQVKERKLTGQVLRVRTGRLRRSIVQKVEQSGNETIGRIGSSVEYARIWELGGTIPAHDIRPKNKLALAFEIGGQKIIVKHVHQPARNVKARPYLRPTIEENRQNILEYLGRAFEATIR